VISRAEFRWDHIEHGSTASEFGASESSNNFGEPNKDNDFLLALNLIYQF
jgi:hypothetical protein